VVPYHAALARKKTHCGCNPPPVPLRTPRQQQKRPLQKVLLNSAKERAEKYQVPFGLTEEDIVIPTHCPVLGLALKRGDPHDKHASPSLDRIRLELGYVRGNVRVISWRANLLKNDATLEELTLVVEDLQRLLTAK
jgi:hypothetical protein